nr:PREDICTED: apyrase-like [Bemisia tabaci]
MMPLKLVLSVVLLVSIKSIFAAELSLIHFNDFHSRFDTVDPQNKGGRCTKDIQDTCVGGFARMHAKIKELKQSDPSALVVNAGDVFTGTLWFGLFRWNVTAEFMNLLPVDVQTIGNHEFDVAGPQAAASYLTMLTNVKTVISNVDASNEPELEPFIQISHIVTRYGLKIGIVGYVTTDYPNLQNTGNLVFHDEAYATNQVIKDLREIDKVDVVVAIAHAGYAKDLYIAKTLDADIIVGAHSHTFLYTGTPPPNYDKPEGQYPTIVTQANGRKVLIVQAGAFSKYIGYLKVKFDQKGGRYSVTSWEGNPILLDKTVRTDPAIEAKLQPWRNEVEAYGMQKIGETLVPLDEAGGVCDRQECLSGRMITDAMVFEYSKQREGRSWTRAAVGVLHADGFRPAIKQGVITYADVYEAFPYNDHFGMVELNGQHVQEFLERSVEKDNSPFLQMSGIKVKFDLTKPPGQRVSEVYVRCATCPIPRYEPLIIHKYYRIIMSEWMYNGGSGFDQIKKRARFWAPGRKDLEIVLDYLQNYSPLILELDENLSIKLPVEANTNTSVYVNTAHK